ncbi:hypothetical protein B566_EDAN010280 [Ephemera danica]|nr:hypothetical protein B566_EDAN010280 [Ephemera danica]
MAKLVDVYVLEENPALKRRQLPLDVDENLTMVMDLSDSDILTDSPTPKGKELDNFMLKYNMLTLQDVQNAFQVTCKDVLEILSQTIPCVGCRRSVEKMFHQLKKYSHPTLDPMIVTKEGFLSVSPDQLNQPQIICTMLQDHNSKLNALVDSQLRSKKSRRCVLHSLESQRSRGPVGGWLDVWESMHPVCREEALLVETSVLLHTLEAYLRKHRFCSECRSKVLQAYSLLVADDETALPPDGTTEPTPEELKGYVPALYDGIDYCSEEKHLHVRCHTDFVAQLITRAEPELNGRERHAKTLEVAQEEVLTCVGLCLYERLHRVQQRLREEERTARVLAAAATQALGRNFECDETTCKDSTCSCEECHEMKEEPLEKRVQTSVAARKFNCGNNLEMLSIVQPGVVHHNPPPQVPPAACQSCQSAQRNPAQSALAPSWTSRCSSQQSQDCGYSSEGNDTISGSCRDCNSSDIGKENNRRAALADKAAVRPSSGGTPLTLLQMLEDPCSSDEEDDERSFIPAEEVQAFQAQLPLVMKKRQELRETLIARFDRLCRPESDQSLPLSTPPC